MALVDTGSRISLLNSKNVKSDIYQRLGESNIKINTIDGEVRRNKELVKTRCPEEFKQPDNARMKWVKIQLTRRMIL